MFFFKFNFFFSNFIIKNSAEQKSSLLKSAAHEKMNSRKKRINDIPFIFQKIINSQFFG